MATDKPTRKEEGACKLCGETRTVERTYTTSTRVTYTVRYFVCKHSR
jgi:hypothetical protein